MAVLWAWRFQFFSVASPAEAIETAEVEFDEDRLGLVEAESGPFVVAAGARALKMHAAPNPIRVKLMR